MASVPLIAAGGFVQAGGFFLALRQAGTMRREEVPDHPPLHRLVANRIVKGIAREIERALYAMKLKQRTPQVGQASARISGAGGMSARGHVVRKGQPVEKRLDEIELEVQELQAKQEDDREALQRRIDGVSEEVKAEAGRLETERKQRLSRSLLWEEAGIWTFILGVAITTAGATV